MKISDLHISLLTKMWHKGAIGMNYKPVEKLMSGIPSDQRGDAKEAMDELVQEGICAFRTGKGEKLAAILSEQVEKVREILRGEVPDYVLNLH
ncbi:MAG: hypothetical protein ABEK16_05110 [Candidatus Nanohalobium sp.]